MVLHRARAGAGPDDLGRGPGRRCSSYVSPRSRTRLPAGGGGPSGTLMLRLGRAGRRRRTRLRRIKGAAAGCIDDVAFASKRRLMTDPLPSAGYRQILVPIDGSPTAGRGLDLAVQLASLSGARLRIVHVLDDLRFPTSWAPGAVYETEVLPRMRSQAAALVAAAAERARAASVVADTAVLECFAVRASELIVSDARTSGSDLIVLGTHGRRGADRLFMGSDAEDVVRTASVPVLLVRCPDAATAATPTSTTAPVFRRVLVPVDGSATARAGLREAIRVAGLGGGRIGLLHVVDELSVPLGVEICTADIAGLMQEAGHEVLEEAESLCAEGKVAAEKKLFESLGGRVSNAILEEAARWQADLIVIGTHGRRGIGRMLLGSDAESVLRRSSVPVLLVRGPGRAADDELREAA